MERKLEKLKILVFLFCASLFALIFIEKWKIIGSLFLIITGIIDDLFNNIILILSRSLD